MKLAEEQVKEFWEWCGWIEKFGGKWRYEEFRTTNHWWESPNGRRFMDLPSLEAVEALGYLFKWAVPKLWKAEKVKALLDEGFISRVVQYPVVKLLPISKGYGSVDYAWNCFLTLVYKPYLDSDKEERKEIHTTDSDPAPALFWAIDKVREGEG